MDFRRNQYFSPKVEGRPKYKARFIEQGLCRLRWIATAWPLLGVMSWFALAVLSRGLASSFYLNYSLAIGLAHFLMIAPAIPMLTSGSRFSIRSANIMLFCVCASVLAGAGIVQGGSHFNPAFAGFGFAYAAVLGFAPLSVVPLVLLLCIGLGTSLATAALTHFSQHLHDDALARLASLTTCIALGVIGICINRWLYRNHRVVALSQLRLVRQSADLERAKCRAELLLDRALTRPVAQELRRHKTFPPSTAEVCIIESDIVGFSDYCENVPVKVVLSELRRFSQAFEECCMAYGVEPLHSWGDANLAVAGLGREPEDQRRVPEIGCALAMLDLRKRMLPAGNAPGPESKGIWPARMGIHCGPVMMAVMDGARLRFDIWGETVNIAARLEQSAAPNAIQVSEQFLLASRGLFDHGQIREIQVKHTVVRAAELVGIKPEYRNADGQANDRFWSICDDPDYGIYYPDRRGTVSLRHTVA